MTENPLLPNTELRALHALLKRAAKAETAAAHQAARTGKRAVPSGGREALLAGILLQLLPGDVLVAAPEDLVLAGLIAAGKSYGTGEAESDGKPEAPVLPPKAPQLLLAAGMAAALPHRAGTDQRRPLAVALLRSGLREPSWDRALAWAQEQRLPLILAFADRSGANALRPATLPKGDTISWPALAKTARRLSVPVLTVDGEDAVAVYRVMQESVLRARAGDGPAVLWAVLPDARKPAADRPAATCPLRRLEQFLRARKISV